MRVYSTPLHWDTDRRFQMEADMDNRPSQAHLRIESLFNDMTEEQSHFETQIVVLDSHEYPGINDNPGYRKQIQVKKRSTRPTLILEAESIRRSSKLEVLQEFFRSFF